MKKKITIKELKFLIKEEASKLQRRTLLENEKKKLMEELNEYGRDSEISEGFEDNFGVDPDVSHRDTYFDTSYEDSWDERKGAEEEVEHFGDLRDGFQNLNTEDGKTYYFHNTVPGTAIIYYEDENHTSGDKIIGKKQADIPVGFTGDMREVLDTFNGDLTFKVGDSDYRRALFSKGDKKYDLLNFAKKNNIKVSKDGWFRVDFTTDVDILKKAVENKDVIAVSPDSGDEPEFAGYEG
jgi:hypothetical protein